MDQQQQRQEKQQQQEEEENEVLRRRSRQEEEERIKIQKRQYEHRLMIGLGLPLHPYCPHQHRLQQQQQQQIHKRSPQTKIHSSSSQTSRKMPMIRILIISDIDLQSASRLAEFTLRGGCDDSGRKLGGGGIDLCCIVGPLHSSSDSSDDSEEEDDLFANYYSSSTSSSSSRSKHMTRQWINTPIERQSIIKGLITSTISQLETIVCRVLYIPGYNDPPQLLLEEKSHSRVTPNSKNVQKRWLNICNGLGIFGLSECQEVKKQCGGVKGLSSSRSSSSSSLSQIRFGYNTVVEDDVDEEEEEDSSSFESGHPSLHTSSSSSSSSSSFSSFLESLHSDDGFLSALEEEEEEDREITNYPNEAKKLLHIAPKHHPTPKIPFVNSVCQGIFMTHIRPRSQKFIKRQQQEEEKRKKKQCKKRKRNKKRRKRQSSKKNQKLGFADDEIIIDKEAASNDDECDALNQKMTVNDTKKEEGKKQETKHSAPYWPNAWPSSYRQLFDSEEFQKNVVLSITSPPFPVRSRNYDAGSCRGVDPRQSSTLLRQDGEELQGEDDDYEYLGGGGGGSSKPFEMQMGNVTMLNPGSLRMNGDFALVDMVLCSSEDVDDGENLENGRGKWKGGDGASEELKEKAESSSPSSYQWRVHHVQFHSLNQL